MRLLTTWPPLYFFWIFCSQKYRELTLITAEMGESNRPLHESPFGRECTPLLLCIGVNHLGDVLVSLMPSSVAIEILHDRLKQQS
jgi:hypothetical protein